MTLYLKYRPKTLEELDLDSVRETLTKTVSSQNIPHAFLFTGPKGTGKTSSARVLAKILNCTKNKKFQDPCNKCDQCTSIDKGSNLDVIEIDAASHRGIDDVRSLRDAVKLSPVSANKKVYIIDEAHMLTTEASNALLKTLEEPPEHVVFILATTNSEKLIDTIRSRCTIVQFKKASDTEIERSISRIAKGESYKIGDDGLMHIARYSEGSFRDAAKILEQIISEGVKLDANSIKDYLTEKKVLDVSALLGLIKQKDTQKALVTIEDMAKSGYVFSDIISQILGDLHTQLLEVVQGNIPNELNKEEIINLIELLQTAKKDTFTSPVEQLPLEIAVIKWGENKNGEDEFDREIDEIKQKKIKTTVLKDSKPIAPRIVSGNALSDDTWSQILLRVKPVNTSIEALLRAAKPVDFDGQTLTLGVYYKFHKERLEENKNKVVLENVVAEVMQKPTKVVCLLTEPETKVVEQVQTSETVLSETQDEDIVKVAKDIFES